MEPHTQPDTKPHTQTQPPYVATNTTHPPATVADDRETLGDSEGGLESGDSVKSLVVSPVETSTVTAVASPANTALITERRHQSHAGQLDTPDRDPSSNALGDEPMMIDTQLNTTEKDLCVGPPLHGDCPPAKSDPLNESAAPPRFCKVCDSPQAAGMYFGVLACIPCKAFFIRCLTDIENGIHMACVSQDKPDRCEITLETRTVCKACRFQKCLREGMARKERPASISNEDGRQLCAVCADIANGIHFGAVTCEGCKKFYRRAMNEAPSYTCKHQENCEITARTRNCCRYCRWHKCLRVGMSKQAIRMGRPSKFAQLQLPYKTLAQDTDTQSPTETTSRVVESSSKFSATERHFERSGKGPVAFEASHLHTDAGHEPSASKTFKQPSLRGQRSLESAADTNAKNSSFQNSREHPSHAFRMHSEFHSEDCRDQNAQTRSNHAGFLKENSRERASMPNHSSYRKENLHEGTSSQSDSSLKKNGGHDETTRHIPVHSIHPSGNTQSIQSHSHGNQGNLSKQSGFMKDASNERSVFHESPKHPGYHGDGSGERICGQHRLPPDTEIKPTGYYGDRIRDHISNVSLNPSSDKNPQLCDAEMKPVISHREKPKDLSLLRLPASQHRPTSLTNQLPSGNLAPTQGPSTQPVRPHFSVTSPTQTFKMPLHVFNRNNDQRKQYPVRPQPSQNLHNYRYFLTNKPVWATGSVPGRQTTPTVQAHASVLSRSLSDPRSETGKFYDINPHSTTVAEHFTRNRSISSSGQILGATSSDNTKPGDYSSEQMVSSIQSDDELDPSKQVIKEELGEDYEYGGMFSDIVKSHMSPTQLIGDDDDDQEVFQIPAEDLPNLIALIEPVDVKMEPEGKDTCGETMSLNSTVDTLEALGRKRKILSNRASPPSDDETHNTIPHGESVSHKLKTPQSQYRSMSGYQNPAPPVATSLETGMDSFVRSLHHQQTAGNGNFISAFLKFVNVIQEVAKSSEGNQSTAMDIFMNLCARQQDVVNDSRDTQYSKSQLEDIHSALTSLLTPTSSVASGLPHSSAPANNSPSGYGSDVAMNPDTQAVTSPATQASNVVTSLHAGISVLETSQDITMAADLKSNKAFTQWRSPPRAPTQGHVHGSRSCVGAVSSNQFLGPAGVRGGAFSTAPLNLSGGNYAARFKPPMDSGDVGGATSGGRSPDLLSTATSSAKDLSSSCSSSLFDRDPEDLAHSHTQVPSSHGSQQCCSYTSPLSHTSGSNRPDTNSVDSTYPAHTGHSAHPTAASRPSTREAGVASTHDTTTRRAANHLRNDSPAPPILEASNPSDAISMIIQNMMENLTAGFKSGGNDGIMSDLTTAQSPAQPSAPVTSVTPPQSGPPPLLRLPLSPTDTSPGGGQAFSPILTGLFPPTMMPPTGSPPGIVSPRHFTPGHFQPGDFPSGNLPPGSMPPVRFPPNTLPPRGLPPNSLLPGSLPPDSLPPGSLSRGNLPPRSLPPGSLPPGSLPPRSLPPGSLAPGSLPPGGLPPRSLPPGSLPSGSLPPGGLPPRGLPPGGLPPGGLPPRGLPPGSLPPGSLARENLPPGSSTGRSGDRIAGASSGEQMEMGADNTEQAGVAKLPPWEPPRIDYDYWLQPKLPNPNIFLSESHNEYIHNLLSGYKDFIDDMEGTLHYLQAETRKFLKKYGEMVPPLEILRKELALFAQSTVSFCCRIPDFQSLSKEDQMVLYRVGGNQSRVLTSAVHWFDKEAREYTIFYPLKPHPGRMDYEFYMKGKDFCQTVQENLEMDLVEESLLQATLFYATDYQGLNNTKLISKLRWRALECFRAYTTAKYGSSNTKIEDLFSVIPQLRQLGLLEHALGQNLSLLKDQSYPIPDPTALKQDFPLPDLVHDAIMPGPAPPLGLNAGQHEGPAPPLGLNAGQHEGPAPPLGFNAGQNEGPAPPLGLNAGQNEGPVPPLGFNAGQNEGPAPPLGLNAGQNEGPVPPLGLNAGQNEGPAPPLELIAGQSEGAAGPGEYIT